MHGRNKPLMVSQSRDTLSSSRSNPSMRACATQDDGVERVWRSWRFSKSYREWVEQGLENGLLMRDDRWSESIAVGSLAFIDKMKSELGVRAAHRDVIEARWKLRAAGTNK
jgi:hypothetical protein